MKKSTRNIELTLKMALKPYSDERVQILKRIVLNLSSIFSLARANQMSAESLSEFVLTATVYGKGLIRAKVLKHLAPVTVSKIRQAVPFGGNANFFERNFAYILTPVVAGEEKSKKEFKKGSLTFMPAGGMLCFFLQDTKSYKPMNLLGEISEGLDLLSNLGRGDTVKVESIISARSLL